MKFWVAPPGFMQRKYIFPYKAVFRFLPNVKILALDILLLLKLLKHVIVEEALNYGVQDLRHIFCSDEIVFFLFLFLKIKPLKLSLRPLLTLILR